MLQATGCEVADVVLIFIGQGRRNCEEAQLESLYFP